MSEADKRPLTERDKKILNEVRKVQKLRREQGCKILDCGVVTNNTNLRIEIIDLKRKVQEQEKIIDLMAQDIEKITGSCPFDLHDYQIEDCDHICQKLADNGKQYTCFIEYYEKKVKGE